MSNAEQKIYPPGIYIEMYHAQDSREFNEPTNGLHAYLVYRTPEGRELVLRGGQPTARQGGLARIGRGLFGGHIETQTGELSQSSDANNGTYRPNRMVIPVKTGAYDAVLWAKAQRRVEEIGRQKYDYDVTESSVGYTAKAQNSNSVVAAALREMGINPLDIVPDDLVPHLPGIDNDLTHGPEESAPRGKPLTIPRNPSQRAKPKPVNTDLLKKEGELRQQRLQQEKQQEEDRDLRLPSLPPTKEKDFAAADEKAVKRLAAAVTAPPKDDLEAATLADPKQWNYGQLNHAMHSDAYWNSRNPLSEPVRKGVSARFKSLPRTQKPKRGMPQPDALPQTPAKPLAKGGGPLEKAQKAFALDLTGFARRTDPTKATRVAQKAMNTLTFKPDSPLKARLPEPLKEDGDFGPKTQSRSREVLHQFGYAAMQQAMSDAAGVFRPEPPR